MGTTLDIDEDLLQAAKELAVARKITTSEVLPNLLGPQFTQAKGGVCGTASSVYTRVKF